MEAIIPKDYPYSLKLLVLETKLTLVAEIENKHISRFAICKLETSDFGGLSEAEDIGS